VVEAEAVVAACKVEESGAAAEEAGTAGVPTDTARGIASTDVTITTPAW
jgi:hypothetical protein